MKMKLIMASLAMSFAVVSPAAAANLVQNGDFEQNGGVGQPGQTTTLDSWTLGATLDAAPYPFGFVVDDGADDGGFPSVFSPPNIKVWGPGTGANNGFTGSSNGGKFFGGLADYAAAPLQQTINGLAIGQQYELSFEWAGAQFGDAIGAYTVGFNINFGGDSATTGTQGAPSRGFLPWTSFSTTFTASSVSQLLSFQAITGSPGLNPLALLDGVSLTQVAPPPPAIPEPASWMMLIVGFGLVGAMARRRALRTA